MSLFLGWKVIIYLAVKMPKTFCITIEKAFTQRMLFKGYQLMVLFQTNKEIQLLNKML